MNVRFIKSALWAAKLFNKKLVVNVHITFMTLWSRNDRVGSKEAKACKENDILALTKSDYIIHTAGQELAYWEKLLNIDIDQESVYSSYL